MSSTVCGLKHLGHCLMVILITYLFLFLFVGFRTDPCFRTLESLLSEALPVLVHKPALLVLAANFCTLGLMMGRLMPATSGDLPSVF